MSNKVIFKSFISIFVFLSVILSFNSCKNFLSGSKLKEELDESIEYANAKKISVLFLPEEGTGSTIPSGNYEAKKGYPFKITFSENSEQYSFVRWIAVKNNVEVTEGVNFENPDAYETNVTIKEADGIKIYPLCKKRIELATEPSPRYEPNGVSRDRSILVEFTKVPKNNCFIFYENELPEGAEPVVNAEGQIWAYKKDGYTYLKNVSITNSDDISIAEHFNQPEIEENRLFITVNKENPIEFETGVIYKTVKVTLSNNICDEDGITMYSDKGWRYQITEDTDEKATVNLRSDIMEGSVYLAGQKDYSIGQKITLSFTENADYQFLYWSYDNAIISVTEPKNTSTTAIIKEKTENTPTEIKAVCAPRLRIESFSPETNNVIKSVAKDSVIEIAFNKELPKDEESIKQLEKIIISVGGTPVNTSFEVPKINEADNKKIIIGANKSNMIDVPEGQTKTVTVSIPDDFYYLLEDGTKVTYGGSGKIFSYIINETTFDKAGVSYSVTEGSGTINIDTSNQPFEYSLGQVIPLKFTTNDGWNFYGWDVLDSEGKAVDKKYLEVKKEKDGEYYLYVKESIQGITIKPDCSEQLKIVSVTPSPEGVNPKDKNIEITFNKNIDESCRGDLKDINIYINNTKSNQYFETRELQTNKIVIKNTKDISIEEDETKDITVEIPSKFHYSDGKRDISLKENYSSNYRINYTTSQTSDVTFLTDNSSSSQIKVGTVYLDYRTPKTYNIGQTEQIEYPLGTGYLFRGWKLIAPSGYTVEPADYVKNGTIQIKKEDKVYFELKITDSNNTNAQITLKKALGETEKVQVVAKDALIPKIESVTPDFKSEGINCDSSIIIKFNKSIDVSTITWGNNANIQIVNPNNNTVHYEDCFFEPIIDSDSKKITIVPKKDIVDLVENGLIDLMVKIDQKNIKDTDGISLNEDEFSGKIYRINKTFSPLIPTINTLDLYLPNFYNLEDPDINGFIKIPQYETQSKIVDSRKIHTQNYVYINCIANDSGLGIDTLKIKETVITSKGPSLVEKTANEFIFSNNNTKYTLEPRKNSGEPYYKYYFESTEDGLIKLEIGVIGIGERVSETKTFYIIRDTILDETLIKPKLNYCDLTINDKVYAQPIITPDGYTLTNTARINNSYVHKKKDDTDKNKDSIRYMDNSSKDTVEFDFSGNTKDYYYNTNYSDVNISVYYSYDKVTYNPVSQNNNKYTFTREAYKNTYIKYEIEDKVGNKKEVYRSIPKTVNIVNFSEYKNSSGSIGHTLENKDLNDSPQISTYLSGQKVSILNNFDIENLSKETNANSYGYYVLFKYKAEVNAEYGTEWLHCSYLSSLDVSKNDFIPFEHKLNMNYIDLKNGDHYVSGDILAYRQPGYYKFHIIPFVKYDDGIYCGTINESGYEYEYKVNSTGTGEYLKNYLPTINDPVVELSVNELSKITLTMNLDNDKINYAQENNIQYYYKLGNNYYEATLNGSTEILYPTDYGKKVVIYLYLKDKNGKNYTKNSGKVVNFDKDNVKPYLYTRSNGIDGYEKYSTRHSNYISLLENGWLDTAVTYGFPKDDGVGLKKNEKGMYELKYYILRNPQNQQQALSYTKEQLKNVTPFIYEFSDKTYKTGIINLPIDYMNYEQGYYTVVLDLIDNADNEKLEYLLIDIADNYLNNQQELFIRDLLTKNITYSVKDNKLCFENLTDRFYMSLEYLEFNDDYSIINWKPQLVGNFLSYYSKDVFYLASDNTIGKNKEGLIDILDYDLIKNKFYCMNLYVPTFANTNPPIYYKKMYFCPSYDKGDITVKNKNVFTNGLNGYQLFCDAPCFIHTLYSSKNMGTDKDAWATFAFEVQSEYTEQNITYIVDKDKIPQGSYYTTIFHFADGTSIMIDVAQR